jgi:ribonuclease Z
MKKTLASVAVALVVLVIASAGLFWLIPGVQDWLLLQGASRRIRNTDTILPSTDGIRIILCVTSPPRPSKTRAKSCAAVIAGNRIFIVDTGPGSANNLNLWRFPMERISAILLTHFHSDHIGDLGEFRMLSWAAGRSTPLTVFGPDGVEDVVRGFNLAYQADDDYRSALHGLPTTEAPLIAHPFGLASAAERTTHMADTVLLDDGGLKITAFQVNHEPVYPAVGYRFDYKGRSVVFSGDTIRWPNVVTHAANADVLIHEAQSEDARRILVQAFRRNGQDQLAEIMTDTSRYHTTALDVASVANEASVRLLVFNHLGPSAPDNLLTRLIFARGLNKIRPPSQWRTGFDGMIIDLPAGERTIQFAPKLR